MEEKKPKYIVVSSELLSRLEKEVNENIELGYIPMGNLVSISTIDSNRKTIQQVMILKEDKQVL